MSWRRRDHVLATILYTDIVGSSRIAAELGDRRWRVLLARHHTIVRRELKRHGGREIDNAGDGFLAAFKDQERAIRCACAISEAVRPVGIDIRAGLHVGQAEVVGRKLGGVVMNAGARIMSEAGAGEVLVSGVLKDLVPGSGFTFTDRGRHELRGIDGTWRLWAVTGVDGKPRPPTLDRGEAAQLRASIKPPPLAERRSGRAALVALAAAVAVAAVVIVRSREPPIEIRPNSLVRIDPSTNEIIADVVVEDPETIAAVPPNELWVLETKSQAIAVIDVRSNERARVVGGLGTGAVGYGIDYAFGSIWVTGSNDTVLRISPASGLVQKSFELTGPAWFLSAGYDRLWVTGCQIEVGPVNIQGLHINRLFGIVADSNQIELVAKVRPCSAGMAVGEGAVWVSDSFSAVSRIDPETGNATHIEMGVEETLGTSRVYTTGNTSDIVVGFDSVWVSDVGLGYVHRIDPHTNEVVASIRVGKRGRYIQGCCGIASDGRDIWVASPESMTVVRIDPSTELVESRIRLPYTPDDLIVAHGSVWVTVKDG